MNSWTWHLARSLFGLAGKPVPDEPDLASLPPPVREAPVPLGPGDDALLLACRDLVARCGEGAERLGAIPDGAWREFADAVADRDDALRLALERVADMRAGSPA